MESNEQIKTYVEKCIRLCQSKQLGYEEKASKCISNLLHSCIIHIQQSAKKDISHICEYIAEYADQELTTEALSNEFGFSRSYFSIYFKKHTGYTIHEFVTRCRLERAKYLLMEDILSVEQIAHEIGFSDVGTFIRAFKKKEKLTPAKYRKILLKH